MNGENEVKYQVLNEKEVKIEREKERERMFDRHYLSLTGREVQATG